MNIDEKEIWTIGHSNRSKIEFLNCLRSFRIEALVDSGDLPVQENILISMLRHSQIIFQNLTFSTSKCFR